MKVYLDDERTTPNGWVRIYWPDEAVKLLSTGEVTELSLDHDLAMMSEVRAMTLCFGLKRQ